MKSPGLKYALNQKHIKNSAHADAEKSALFPEVKQNHGGDGEDLGNAVGVGQKRHAFEAVDHQQRHEGAGQGVPQIQDDSGRFLSRREKEKGAGSCGKNRGGDNENVEEQFGIT